MKENVTVTVPLTHSALTRASEMLAGIAADILADSGPAPDERFTENQLIAIEGIIENGTKQFGCICDNRAGADIESKIPVGEGRTAAPASDATEEGTAPDQQTADQIVETQVTPVSVNLADGIPWDARIHSGRKTTLAAAPHGWKLKRKPKDIEQPEWDAYVKEVETELRTAMAVPSPDKDAAMAVPGPDNDVAVSAFGGTTGVDQTPTTTGADYAPPPPATETTVQIITNFAELSLAITSNNIPHPAVESAVLAVGLPSYLLLAARPDLIKPVADLLFP